MQYVFGKTITTAKGTYKMGEPLPEHWTGKETMRQLRASYGEDVLVEGKTAAETFTTIGQRLEAIEQALADIKAAIGIKGANVNGEIVRKRPGRPRRPVEASPSA